MSNRAQTKTSSFRHWTVLLLVVSGLGLLVVRAAYLQVLSSEYLQAQGNARHLRVAEYNAVRGMILDRNGVPLAISTPVDSVWAHPPTLMQAGDRWGQLTALLDLDRRDLSDMLARHAAREFMYLKRHVTPEIAKRVMALQVPGVALQREYRRYYPAGAVAGHVIGFTNIDDQGQEGLELAYDEHLRAIPGKKRVLKDRLGNIVESVESLSLPIPGKDLVVSLDRRIQYLAYRELKRAVAAHKARAAWAIVLDVRTGEVLAMVNEPGFNPNNRADLRSALFRNRAVTDVIEPGSTLKPFTIAAALESGKYTPDSLIDTAPGVIRIGHKTIKDVRDHGRLTVAGVIKKSSNVGATKIALGISKNRLWNLLRGVGFGETTGSGLPGESAGIINPPERWAAIDRATLSFGYGISITPLQLARAYTAIANDGVLVPVSLLHRDGRVQGQRVMAKATALQVRRMLEMAVSGGGTGTAAQVNHYSVAGKTGTVHKLINGNYAQDNYVSLFAGVAPASRPRLVMVVAVDDPKSGGYFGGQIAAPIFSKVMAGAMRLLNISPDAPRPQQPTIVKASERRAT